MSTNQEIRNKVYDILKDYKVHSTEEIRQSCIDAGIITVENAKIVRVVIFNMKKDNSNIVSPSRGKYRLISTEISNFKIDISTAINLIDEKLVEWQNLNWLECSDSELKAVRSQYKELMALSNRIKHFQVSN